MKNLGGIVLIILFEANQLEEIHGCLWLQNIDVHHNLKR